MEDSLFSALVSPVYLVSARAGTQHSGMITTWLMPASLASGAARTVAALSPLHFTTALVRASGRFVVQLLSAAQAELLESFGLRSGREIDKFAGLAFSRSKSGIPVLPGSCGWLECELAAELDCGDRILVVARVTQRGEQAPLPPLLVPDAFAALPESTRERLAQRWRADLARDAGLSSAVLSLRRAAPAEASTCDAAAARR